MKSSPKNPNEKNKIIKANDVYFENGTVDNLKRNLNPKKSKI